MLPATIEDVQVVGVVGVVGDDGTSVVVDDWGSDEVFVAVTMTRIHQQVPQYQFYLLSRSAQIHSLILTSFRC